MNYPFFFKDDLNLFMISGMTRASYTFYCSTMFRILHMNWVIEMGDRLFRSLPLQGHPSSLSGVHFFFKSKELIILFWYVSCVFTDLVWIFVLRIKKFYNLKPATIDIEMNVSLVVIGGMCLSGSCFRMQFLYRFPYLQSISCILCA